MKALLLTGFFTLVSSLAYAGGDCCASGASADASKSAKTEEIAKTTDMKGTHAHSTSGESMAELKKAAAAGCPFSSAKLAKMEKTAGADCEEAAACAEGAKDGKKMAETEESSATEKEVSATKIEGAENKL